MQGQVIGPGRHALSLVRYRFNHPESAPMARWHSRTWSGGMRNVSNGLSWRNTKLSPSRPRFQSGPADELGEQW